MKTGFPVIFFLLFLYTFLLSCEESSVPADDTLPVNLSIDVEVSEEGDGWVRLLAEAENTVEYRFFITNPEEHQEANTSGFFEYQYFETGNYEIEVRAYSIEGRFLRRNIGVEVHLGREPVSVEVGYTTPLQYEGWSLVWNDEFDSNEINSDNWVFETGTGCPNLCGWGNNERQYYTQNNAWIEQEQNVLVIEARNENIANSQYTSSRMKTEGLQSFRYGRIDIRALLPYGQGIWPALWMLGDNISSIGWPRCGEIDIMELIGGSGKDNEVHGTLHWYSNGHAYTGGSHKLSSGIFADSYHVFTIIWDENAIQWFVDDIKYHEISITPSNMAAFQESFFFIFNVAVGGNWGGYPDQTTIFPQQMRVDYIRVFQQD